MLSNQQCRFYFYIMATIRKIKTFCSKDRPVTVPPTKFWVLRIQEQGEYLYAGNFHMILRCKAENVEYEKSDVENTSGLFLGKFFQRGEKIGSINKTDFMNLVMIPDQPKLTINRVPFQIHYVKKMFACKKHFDMYKGTGQKQSWIYVSDDLEIVLMQCMTTKGEIYPKLKLIK